MLFFTVNNWRLEPTPELLQVPALAAIIGADRTRDKATAMSDLLYIYGMVQPKGPFSDFHIGVRDRMVRKAVYGQVDAGPYETSHPVRWQRIMDGIGAYLDHNSTAEQRLLNELENSIDWVTDSLKTMRSKTDVKPADIKSFISSMKEVNNLLTNKKQAEKLLEVGLEASQQKSKAGLEATPLEKGLMKTILGQRNIAAEESED